VQKSNVDIDEVFPVHVGCAFSDKIDTFNTETDFLCENACSDNSDLLSEAGGNVSGDERPTCSIFSDYVFCQSPEAVSLPHSNLSREQVTQGHVYTFDESLFGAPVSDDSDDDSGFTPPYADYESDKDENEKSKQFLFMHWNVNGLMTKLFDNDFVSFVSSFHFVCLVETFVSAVKDDAFPGFTVFCQPAVKLSVAGRPSGGVVCLIKNEFIRFVKQIKVNVGPFLLFVISKEVFGLEKDVLYVCAYIQPEGSRYYTFLGVEGDGIAMLENCLIDHALAENDYYVFLSGDLNARTSNVSQQITQDYDTFDDLHRDSVDSVRYSQDSTLNGFGKSLLDMCTALNLCIMNGMCHGDLKGCYTYVCDSGSSVIDYFLMSSDLLALVYDKCTLNVLDCIETNHMPVVCSVLFPQESNVKKENCHGNVFVDKLVWQKENVQRFNDSLSTERAHLMLENAIGLIDIDIDVALNVFNDCIREVAACMKKRMRVNGRKKKQDWYDAECKTMKKNLRKLLKTFRRTLSADDRFAYCKNRREYKNMLLCKQKKHNASVVESLLATINSQQDFWDTVHNILPKRNCVRNQISVEEWFEHFKRLLEKDDVQAGFTERDDEDVLNDEDIDAAFNRPISLEEVLFALRKLKCKKASGPDGIIGEIFKNASVFVAPFFVRFFNVLFDKGIYPENWMESVILPLYKKGDVNSPGNYRGISLSDTSSKVFGTIINRRLQAWAEENNITGEYQAGFKKGYSTVDHLFTLLACVQKQFNMNRKLYVAFIDFEKCFDTINRNLLWPVLLKNSIKGKLFRCVRSMYVSVKARVRCGARLTDYVNCTFGVKQGDICSPVLFSLFINELALEVIRNGRHGVTFSLDAFELFILLLADDVVLLSETVIGLQTQLNSLCRAARSLSLKVNMDKSNIIVFRKGGYLGARERWVYDGIVMPVVNAYKYLGIYFSTRLSFVAACRDIASKAKKALLCIIQRLRMYNCSSFDVYMKLFDAQVQPIMQYGSEIWGLDKAAQHCEKVHLFALKKFLSVDLRTPNDFVYNELGRHPTIINSVINCIRYWLKLLVMDDNRLPKKAYVMLRKLDERGKVTWVTNVRKCLFQYGFGFVWLNQGVGGVKEFLRFFKQRMIDCKWQNWNEHVNDSERFCVYRTFCDFSHSLPLYLNLEMDSHLKFIMTKFRFGVSDIAVHHFRYRQHTPRNLICPVCKNGEENEIHFVFCCPLYEELRKTFIAPKFYRNPSSFHLSLLLSSRNSETVRNLCVYLYKAFKKREIVLS
jgi:hypothetical protein